MVRIAGMIENRDAEAFASEWALDVAPRGAALFALPAAESVRVQVRLTRIGFVPRHPDRESADEEFAERHVLFLRAQQKIEIDHVSIWRFGRINRDRVFFFEHHAS